MICWHISADLCDVIDKIQQSSCVNVFTSVHYWFLDRYIVHFHTVPSWYISVLFPRLCLGLLSGLSTASFSDYNFVFIFYHQFFNIVYHKCSNYFCPSSLTLMFRRQQDKVLLNWTVKHSNHSSNSILLILIYWYFYFVRLFQFWHIIDGFSNGLYVAVLPYILATINEQCLSLRRQDNFVRSDNTVRVLYMESIRLMEVTDALHGPIYWAQSLCYTQSY